MLRDRLDALRALGMTIALDDFGTGYSNLWRLTRLPFDRIKIDRSLSAMGGLAATEIVACIVRLGKALAQEVVAEGIETAEQAKVLADLGCDLLQGFGLSAPLSEADLLQWAAAPNASFKAA